MTGLSSRAGRVATAWAVVPLFISSAAAVTLLTPQLVTSTASTPSSAVTTVNPDSPAAVDTTPHAAPQPGKVTVQAARKAQLSGSGLVPPEEAGSVAQLLGWNPGFATLSIKTADSRAAGVVVDDLSAEAQRRWAIFEKSAIPTHHCGLVRIHEGMTPATVQRRQQAYVNCIVDAWQPLLKKAGVVYSAPRVVNCAATPKAEECHWVKGSGAAGMASKGWILTPGTKFYGALNNSIILLHELTHTLQQTAHEQAANTGAFRVAADPDKDRASRRSELQAHCMAMAMVHADSDNHITEGVLQATGWFVDSDPQHWSAAAMEFWGHQAIKGTVGACDTQVAANALVAYPAGTHAATTPV